MNGPKLCNQDKTRKEENFVRLQVCYYNLVFCNSFIITIENLVVINELLLPRMLCRHVEIWDWQKMKFWPKQNPWIDALQQLNWQKVDGFMQPFYQLDNCIVRLQSPFRPSFVSWHSKTGACQGILRCNCSFKRCIIRIRKTFVFLMLQPTLMDSFESCAAIHKNI